MIVSGWNPSLRTIFIDAFGDVLVIFWPWWVSKGDCGPFLPKNQSNSMKWWFLWSKGLHRSLESGCLLVSNINCAEFALRNGSPEIYLGKHPVYHNYQITSAIEPSRKWSCSEQSILWHWCPIKICLPFDALWDRLKASLNRVFGCCL